MAIDKDASVFKMAFGNVSSDESVEEFLMSFIHQSASNLAGRRLVVF